MATVGIPCSSAPDTRRTAMGAWGVPFWCWPGWIGAWIFLPCLVYCSPWR